MEIKRYVSPMLDHNMYVISEGEHCIIIDPYYSEDSARLLAGLRLDFMLATHEHYDHISGVNEFKARYGVLLYASGLCGQNLKSPSKNLAKYFEAYFSFQRGVAAKKMNDAVIDPRYVCRADIIVEDGQILEWVGHRILVKSSPGHSPGSTLFMMDDMVMFSGDCMLSEDIPVTRFPGGDKKAYEQITLPYLRSLNGDIVVYPGHGDSFQLKTFYRLSEGPER